MILRHLIFILLYSLAAGTFLSLGCVRPTQMGRSYFLMHGLGAAALAAACAWIAPESLPQITYWTLWGFVGGATVFSLFHGALAWVSWAGFAIATLAFALGLGADAAQISAQFPAYSTALFIGSALSSALMLGFSMAAMLLGHWYLVQPKLSIHELGRITALFLGILGIRFILSTIATYPLISGKSEVELYRYFAGETTGIFLMMRWFWGLIGPAILGYFIWDTVRIRSTQSATGLLYVAVVFVLIGETMGQYLTLYYGIPG